MRGTRIETTRRSAFTLIELLVVISVVALLVSLTLVVGSSVTRNAQVRQTRDVLSILDGILTDYIAEYGGIPPFTGGPDAPGPTDSRQYSPADADEGGSIRPEVAVFLAQARGLQGAEAMIARIPEKFLLNRGDLYAENGDDPLFGSLGAARIDRERQLRRVTVADAWGMEILYVHPANRDDVVGNGDGAVEVYGEPANDRPYFLSAGADNHFYLDENGVDPAGDPYRKDNLYSYESVKRPEREQ